MVINTGVIFFFREKEFLAYFSCGVVSFLSQCNVSDKKKDERVKKEEK